MGGFLADWIGLVDVVDAEHFEVVGAVGLVEIGSECNGNQSEDQDDQLHVCRFIIISRKMDRILNELNSSINN